MPLVAFQFRCVGKVQGVFYRASTKQQADLLGIKGWVRNETNGDVSVHAEGEEQTVMKLYQWCLQGPPLARVQEVIKSATTLENFDRFEVRYF
ncbi:MAG: acylphosphatase [Cytophagales bacterium]|nr:acylphosphatase [Cytophagales bacterium]